MNFRLIITLAVISVSVLSSCKKDKEEPAPANTPDFAVLKEGNYWVYETYFTDENGVVSLTDYYDSVYIKQDTVINGKTYFLKIDSRFEMLSAKYWREENGELINEKGNIMPTDAGYIATEYFIANQDTLSETTSTLLPEETYLNVPAGVFKVKTIEYVSKNYLGSGQQRQTFIKKYHTKYHPAKGDIARKFVFAYPTSKAFYEQVLVRTNVE